MTPKERLEYLNASIAMALQLIGEQRETIEAFRKESRDLENFGHIVAPTLYKNRERQITAHIVGPIYDAALNFVRAYETHTAKPRDALAKVSK